MRTKTLLRRRPSGGSAVLTNACGGEQVLYCGESVVDWSRAFFVLVQGVWALTSKIGGAMKRQRKARLGGSARPGLAAATAGLLVALTLTGPSPAPQRL